MTVLPDVLQRNDIDSGPWSVRAVTHGPGQAWTAIGERIMQVPNGSTVTERSVRAHEMMHAKVSPHPTDMVKWHDRQRASVDALTSVEEARVNYLIKKAGFDVEHLTDGSETQTGELVASENRWRDAVMMTAGFAGTGRFKKYLVGVRRHNDEWAKTLRVLHDKIIKEIAAIPISRLASTDKLPDGMSPRGFLYTEMIAAMIDFVSENPPTDTQAGDESSPSSSEQQPDDSEMTQPVTPENIKRMKPTTPEGHHWDTVRISRPPRNRRAAGGIGRKRVAAPTGKNPRRIGRLLTDPQRKIFDGKVAGKGGVVVIDGSGSMRMSPQDINAITEAAPGCTVLMYASSKRNMHDGGPNLWVLAEKGVMVGEIPDRPSGNGLDAPAVRQALSMKQRHDSPVVWITDGYCHGPGQKYSHQAGAECASLVVRNGVIVRPDVDRAVKTLREMRQGRRAKRWMPIYWRDSWQHIYGQDLSGICGTWEL